MAISDYSGSNELLVPQEITGYRAWRVSVHTPRLSSVGRSYFWVPGLNNANCLQGFTLMDHPAPHRGCSCGFYARTSDDAHGYEREGVMGVIKASGRVVLGRRGFRAQHARVVALYGLSPWVPVGNHIKERLSAHYDVPFFSSRGEAFEAFPPDDLSALRPPVSEPEPESESKIRVTQPRQPISGSAIYVTGQANANSLRNYWLNNPPRAYWTKEEGM